MKTKPKTQQIIDYLLGEIKSGGLKEGQRIPSEYKLADMFSVHKSTANKAVGCLVERGFLKRCQGGAGTLVVKTLEYPIGNIGYLITLGSTSYTSLLMNGAQSAAFERSYALNYLQWSSRENMNSFLKMIKNFNTLGLLVTGGPVPDIFPFPTMYVSAVPADLSSGHWVASDSMNSGYLMGKYLLEAGHREIVFISSAAWSLDRRKRLDGFRKSLQEAGFRNIDKRILHLSGKGENLAAVLEDALKRRPRPTVIAMDQDPLALRAIKYLEGKGMKIPHDVSVTGFGMNREFHHHLKITSIEEHPFQVGYHAANRLLDIIENKFSGTVQDTLPVEIIPGNSVSFNPARIP